jgi:uncharacterized protein YjbI with pentapeptide repeats
MDPAVVAAIIAAGVSVITLIGTLAAQYFGRRATSRQLDRTLAEQRTRTLNERFATAADKLGNDKPPTVRLAGVYAMAGLADDWLENRQTCVDVLCGYLRMAYEPDRGEPAPASERLAFRADREVRHTVIRIITAHLKDGAAVLWQSLNFDFTGVVFDGGDFTYAQFSSGTVDFGRAQFSGGTVDFGRAQFSGGTVDFGRAQFSGGTVDFGDAQFSGGTISFRDAQFSGGEVDFVRAQFSGGEVDFVRAQFSGGEVYFIRAQFSGGTVGFRGAQFSGGTVGFGGAQFSRGTVGFGYAVFSGGEVGFRGAQFSGGEVDFGRAQFSGGTVDFRGPIRWLRRPVFDWKDWENAPEGVMLPANGDNTPP